MKSKSKWVWLNGAFYLYCHFIWELMGNQKYDILLKKDGDKVLSVFKSKNPTSTESVDRIENIVYQYLKPLGFRKYGRTLHRFVDGDISQVIHFQNGCPAKDVYDVLWVNLGIRVPECAEQEFVVTKPLKKYYHEYECNIRTRLGSFVDGEDTFYNLKEDADKIGKDIVDRIEKHILPVFDRLGCRDSILKYRKKYSDFDEMNSQILLDEAMIFGKRGNIAEATRLFNAYYQEVLKEYTHDFENGYVTTYRANGGHLDYLEELAEQLNIPLDSPLRG